MLIFQKNKDNSIKVRKRKENQMISKRNSAQNLLRYIFSKKKENFLQNIGFAFHSHQIKLILVTREKKSRKNSYMQAKSRYKINLEQIFNKS